MNAARFEAADVAASGRQAISAPVTKTGLLHAADQQVLDLEVFLDSVPGAFAAQTRLFHAAEWRDFGREDSAVDADHAGLHRFRDAENAADIAAVEVSGEPEFGVVDHRDRFRVGLEAKERRNRAERFFARHLHRLGDAGEDRRLEEQASELVALAAEHDLRAFGRSVGDVLLDFLQTGLVDQRADHDAGLGAGTDLERFDFVREFLRELVVNGVLHVDAIRANAGLAGIAILARDCTIDGGVNVGVVEYDKGRVAAELERELLDRVRRLPHQDAPDFGRAGER